MAEPCVILAQRLAANDKKSRDRALRRLRGYLRERSALTRDGLTLEELCKVWKGLFYCLWMQDKPLLQEELALSIARLLQSLQSGESRSLFLRAFWQTLNREWNGIDRLRLDKFYSLIRFVLHQSAQLLKQADWETSAVEEFLALLVEEVLKSEAPRGVQHHLMDIYLEELAKVGSAELSAEMNLKLIDPFCKIAAKTKDPILQQSVVNGIFQAILDQAPYAIEDLMKELGHTPGDDPAHGGAAEPVSDPDADDVGPVLQFDYQAVSERLFSLASRQNVPARNRKSLYRLVKRFKDLAEGVFPQDEFPEEVSTDEDDDEFSSWRFRKRQKKFEDRLLESQGIAPEPRKKGKRGREAAAAPVEPPEAAAPLPPAAKKRKKKKKKPHPSQEILQSQHNGTAEAPPATDEADQSHAAPSAPLPVTPPPAKAAPNQDFIKFKKSEAPRAVYVKGAKSKGRRVISKPNGKSKKVTFSLNKNMTAEFKRTDRSLLVSPKGSSRVPFNPSQRPQHGVLKTPSPVASRARASDFF
ncbi:ribosomal RNA processing protein 1 homolog A [Gastrophryne carolinensis]